MNIENIMKIIEFIKDETPENEEMVKKAIIAVDEVLQNELNIVNRYITNLIEQMDYDKVQKYLEIAKCITSVMADEKVIFDKIKIKDNNKKPDRCKEVLKKELVEDEMEFASDDQKRINYEKYRIDETIPYALTTDFRYTKPAAFSLDGVRYPARMWKQMLVKSCELLNEKSNKIFNEFLEDKFMQGKTRKYFSKDEKELWNPEKIRGTDVFIETNLSANNISNMILKMLDKYRIPYAAFQVYLSKDLSPLHKDEIIEDQEIEEAAIQEEKLDMKKICKNYDYKTGKCINEESPYFTMECCCNKNCRYIDKKKEQDKNDIHQKVYVYPKDLLKKYGCPDCGISLVGSNIYVQYGDEKNKREINLNVVFCKKCKKIYITEETYNTVISNKDQRKIDKEFVLDFYR